MQRKIVADYLDGTAREPAAPYIVPESEGVNEDTSVEATLANDGSGTTTQEALANGAAAVSAGTAAGADSTGAAARPAKKARYQVNKEDLEAYKRIVAQYEPKQLGDRSTVLRGDAKIVNFGNVRDLIADRLKAGKEDLRKATHPNSGHHASSAPVPSASSQKRRRQANPIIIISPSSSALITMYNVKRFLEESVYEPSETARATSGRIAEDVIHVNRKRQIGLLSGDNARDDGGLSGQNKQERGKAGEKLTRYFVVDGVDALSKFGDDAWDRVVCVMTTGQEWQFRPYKWTEPKELFHHVKGIFVRFTNDPPNPKITNWNVTELKVDPVKRHIDKSVVNDF